MTGRVADLVGFWRRRLEPYGPLTLLDDVPYERQVDDQSCGPACLRMVAAYAGARRLPPARAPATGLGSRRMIHALEAAGLRPIRPPQRVSARRLRDVLRLVAHGPVILALGDGSTETGSHYAVLVGYSRTHLIFHDPFVRPFFPRPRRGFDARWAKEGRWYVGVAAPAAGRRARVDGLPAGPRLLGRTRPPGPLRDRMPA